MGKDLLEHLSARRTKGGKGERGTSDRLSCRRGEVSKFVDCLSGGHPSAKGKGNNAGIAKRIHKETCVLKREPKKEVHVVRKGKGEERRNQPESLPKREKED